MALGAGGCYGAAAPAGRTVTLFDVTEQPPPRASKPLPQADGKPIWSRYRPKKPSRCDECCEVAYETWPGPVPLIRQAKFSRRQGGKTRLYCHAHHRQQRDEDNETYHMREKAS